MVPVVKNIGGRDLWLKTTTLLVFFLWLVKSLKNMYIIGLLITSRGVVFFLISIVEIIVNNRSEVTQSVVLDIEGFDTLVLTGFDTLVFFSNSNLMEYSVG